jgi:alcohol dehydrogenase class IV
MRAFDLTTWPTRVLFGPGRTASLPALLADLGASRPLVVCGKSVASGEMLLRVEAALRGHPLAVFPGVERHAPLGSVRAGADAAVRHRADVLISVGGGSAIDTGKCIALWLACDGVWEPYAIRYGDLGSEARRPLPPHTLPHIAVPTTAGSASEIMPGAGFRDLERGRRVLFRDPRLLPKAAVLDPELAVFADAPLTAATGMTAVARCVEALYSRDRQPLSEGLALHGLRLLRQGLPRSVADPTDLAARADCQVGCLLSGVAVDQAMASLVHAIGHVVGGQYGLPRGVAHGMLLPPALRLLLPALGEGCPGIAEALGLPSGDLTAAGAAGAAARAVAALLETMPLPRRLREVGVPAVDLPGVAAATMRDHMIAYTPRPVTEAEVLALLEAAW